MAGTEKVGVKQTLKPELSNEAKRKRRKQELIAYAFISPWLLGFFGFVIGPMLASLYYSFTDYDMLSSPTWVGLSNYTDLLTSDSRFRTSVQVTLLFVLISTPLKLIFALAVAMLFNNNRRGAGFYTTVFYIPSIIGGSVAVAVMWRQLFGGQGAINDFLLFLGIEGRNWIASPDHALGVLILLVIWQFGSPMIIFLAGLKQIPKDLYEAAVVDGAGAIQKFFSITLPLLTPVIFFNLIMQMIGGFLVFTQAFITTEGGPLDRTLFYALYLYERAFQNYQMGYASAMAWMLLIVVAIITALIFYSSKKWVYYESEKG
ncbi:carbohydrate ABC transporter permease [Alkalicoccobacillus porphyridii]|uniref:Sugar ABC transporter permease n=1 Tax=Alkalicoccobacillus porphyridii TaxID=2597270 RepID=A0A554A2H5_9BACI|nr:sugar ABC transporter permease [Alkalicoccobacillus porphyridii]TSB47890.1 sugar ABC transporter permease [Alkalicoccobacillus porphyridii]